MKKLLALVLIVCALFALTSCGAEKYELAIGVAVANPGESLKTSETVAAVIFDEDGKIVACRIDAVDVELSISDNGLVVNKEYKTKDELGYDYKMAEYAQTKEWFEQARAFESFVVGKTVAEVEGIDPGRKTLVAGCTIDMTDFVKAIVAAGKDNYKVAFESKDVPTLGVSAVTAVANPVTDGEADPTKAEITVDFGAVAMVEGEVVAATLDCAAATLSYAKNEDAYKCTGFDFKGTKRAQGDNYNMVAWGGAIGEWYEQAQAFANTAVGKTASEVAALGTEGVAGCTIYAGSMKQALDKAAQHVR